MLEQKRRAIAESGALAIAVSAFNHDGDGGSEDSDSDSAEDAKLSEIKLQMHLGIWRLSIANAVNALGQSQVGPEGVRCAAETVWQVASTYKESMPAVSAPLDLICLLHALLAVIDKIVIPSIRGGKAAVLETGRGLRQGVVPEWESLVPPHQTQMDVITDRLLKHPHTKAHKENQ